MLSVQDVLFFIFIVLTLFSLICVIYELVRSRKNLKRFDEFVEGVAIGKKYISYIQQNPEDPFEEDIHDIYVIVRGVKRNDSGDTWVKIEWSDGTISTVPVESLYYNFYEDENSNRG